MTAKKKPTSLLVGIDTLASALAVSRRQAYALVTEGVLPKPTARGKYNLPLATSAYIESLRAEKGDAIATALRETKLARAQLELDHRRKELDRSEGVELIPPEAVNAFLAQAFEAYRESLAAFPTRFAPTLAGLSDPRDPHAVFAVLQPAHDAAINAAVDLAYRRLVGAPSTNGNGRAS